MLNLFKKDPKKKLNKQYQKLMQEGYKLSTVNRRLSDQKYAEADKLLKELESLKGQ
jgi:hypothetical protein